MEKSNWELKTYEVPGRRIVWTEGIGKAYPEAVQKVTEFVLAKAKGFGPGKWAYMPGIEKMDPIIDTETQKCFAEMHKKCEEAGCVAFAFISGGMAAIKVQSKRHHQQSHTTGIITEHFRTAEDGLMWLKESFDL